ncbi:hypothetical protein MMC20_002653 [Loxospora ochrophaea]|nr:hypothetical protein [Loxospora ochrophaea]
MASAHLNSFSAELLLLIVFQLSSLNDLCSIIQASLLFYRVFNAHRSLILSNFIDWAILPDALAAYDASKIAAEISRVAELEEASRLPKRHIASLNRSIRQCIIKFLAGCGSQQHNPQRRIRDFSTLARLGRLWRIVDFFVLDYAEKALKNMNSHLKKQGMLNSQYAVENHAAYQPLLSTTERGRLQRAFFRFEIYRKLFAHKRNTQTRKAIMDTADQARLFLGLFQAWEREELSSINEYLEAKMEDCFHELEECFVESVQKAARDDHSGSDTRDKTSEGGGEQYSTLADMSVYGVHFSTQQGKAARRTDHIQFLVALELPFLRHMFELDTKDRMAMISPYISCSYRPTLESMLRYGGSTDKDPDSAHLLSKKNMGWVWAKSGLSHRAQSRHSQPEDIGLRSLGYVFWDGEHLAQMLDFTKAQLEPFPERRVRDRMLSVEKRLSGVKIRVSTKEALDLTMDDEEISELLDDLEY